MDTILRQIDFDKINPLSLPSVCIKDHASMPASPGIYFVLDELKAFQYIGKTQNLSKRWSGHHKTKQVKRLKNPRIHYWICEKEILEYAESNFIEKFNPRLNNSCIRTRRPFGWALSDDKTKLIPDVSPWGNTKCSAWEIARTFVLEYVNGSSLGEVAKIANQHGLAWAGSTFRKWLINPIHQGHSWTYVNKLKKGECRKRSNSQKKINKNTHPPLIAKHEWRTIQKRLKAGKRSWGKNAKTLLNPLRGIATCSSCESILTKETTRLRCRNKKCLGKSIPLEKVEKRLVEILDKHPNLVSSVIAQLKDYQTPGAVSLIEAKAHQAKIQRAYDALGIPELKSALQKIDKILSCETPACRIPPVDFPSYYKTLPPESKHSMYMEILQNVKIKVHGPIRERYVTEVTLVE